MTHEWLKTMPVAHRGLYNNEFPENSIEAFLNAKKHGFAIELDVQLSADNHIVVFHDTDTYRMTGEEGKIKKLNLSELKKKKLLGRNIEIPTLNEVFNALGRDTPVIIEIKNEEKSGDLEKLLSIEMEKRQGICAVQSFNPFSLNFFRKNCPHIPRGQISQNYRRKKLNVFKKFILMSLPIYDLSNPHFISYNIDDFPCKKISSLREKGVIIIGWTIKNEHNFNKAKEYCDNIIFENMEFANDWRMR